MATATSRLLPTSVFVIAFFVLLLATPGAQHLSAVATHGGQADTITLSGQLYDQATGEPLDNVTLLFENRFDHDEEPTTTEEDGEVRYIRSPEEGHQAHKLATGPDGTYSVQLHPGWVHLRIDHPGYQQVNAWTELRENGTLDLPMRAADERGATIQGTITSSDGGPLAGAHVSVSRDHQYRCEADVCYAESEGQAAPAPEGHQDDWRISYEPRHRGYASTETAQDGSYMLQVQPGAVVLRVWAQDHLQGQERFNLSTSETRTVDLSLKAVPANTVTVTGTVVDAQSGQPIPHAWVNAQNHKWGDWQNARTDEAGTYTMELKPGYTILTVDADATYWVPCEAETRELDDRAEPDTATSSAGTSDGAEPAMSDEEPAQATMIAPERRCEPQEREHAYLSQVHTVVPSQGQAITWSPELQRAPAPDATFQGWVINETTEQGIADARVSFHNEETREWGQVTTDEDGSFTIDVRHGYYTIRIWAEGYYPGAVNTRIQAGDTQTLSLPLTGGSTSYGGCCYAEPAVARQEATMASADGAPAMEGGDDGQAATVDSSAAPATDADMAEGQNPSGQDAGLQAYQGEGGGLGPYDASKASAPPPASGEQPSQTPAIGLLMTLSLLGLGAVCLRLWSRD